jgi:hypothetical protein
VPEAYRAQVREIAATDPAKKPSRRRRK